MMNRSAVQHSAFIITNSRELLEIKPEERIGFQRRLAAMERDGEVLRNRRDAICVASKVDLINGVVHGHHDGYGFLVREDGVRPDLFLNFREMQKVLTATVR